MATSTLATVEPMRVADLPTVVAIERQVFTSPWSTRAFLFDLTRRRDAHYLVARYTPWAAASQSVASETQIDPSLMGYAGAWFVVDELHVATIGVRPEWRGRGVGELLFAALLRWAIAQGASFATLEVRASNIPAQRLYAKYGLEQVGRRKRYYTDNREDALLMTAEGLATPAYAAFLEQCAQTLTARLARTLAQPPDLTPLQAVALHK